MRIYESLVKVCFDILYLTVHLNCVMYRFGYTMRWVLCARYCLHYMGRAYVYNAPHWHA